MWEEEGEQYAKKILVADDDLAIGDVLQLMLEYEGYEVEIQVDGQAVWQLREPFPDLLFLDIRLSGMDGRTICQHLKGQESTQHIPIIMISANNDMPHIAKESGADAFVEKPFEMENLLALVAHYII